MRRTHQRTVIVLTLAVGGLTTSAFGQVWQVDLSTSPVLIEGQTFADDLACNGAAFPDLNGEPTAGPYLICPPGFQPPPAPLECDLNWMQSSSWQPNLFAAQCPAGMQLTADFGADVDLITIDGSLFPDGCWLGSPPSWVGSSLSSVITITGDQTRTLEIKWRSTVINNCGSLEAFYARACADLAATVNAQIVKAQPGKPLHIFYEWQFDVIADTNHEDPIMEDPEMANGSAMLDVAGNGPGLLFNAFADGDAGIPFDSQSDADVLVVTPGGNTVDVSVAVHSFAVAQMKNHNPLLPPPPHQDQADAEFCATLTLTIHSRSFNEDMSTYMREVPGNTGPGTGPQYPYRAGRSEITNAQYVDFLTDAQLDGGASGRSSYVEFDASGKVQTTPTRSSPTLLLPQNLLAASRIIYKPNALAGYRYAVEPGFEDHPVVGVTWIGAAKFCNWLTLEQNYAAAQRVYTEGPNQEDWHPATISTADWVTADLDDTQRLDLTRNYRGFRLPMDEQGGQAGWIGNQAGSFNEWYKAAAYDPAAPASARTGPGGEAVPPRHWMYGCGRDAIGSPHGNYRDSGDPFDNDDAPVAYFDGFNALADGTSTADTNNVYGFYDLSGNIAEWVQDQGSAYGRHAIRGGSWSDGLTQTAASYREERTAGQTADNVGFRVLRVPRRVVSLQGPTARPAIGVSPYPPGP